MHEFFLMSCLIAIPLLNITIVRFTYIISIYIISIILNAYLLYMTINTMYEHIIIIQWNAVIIT